MNITDFGFSLGSNAHALSCQFLQQLQSSGNILIADLPSQSSLSS